jgi:hypothetical protein
MDNGPVSYKEKVRTIFDLLCQSIEENFDDWLKTEDNEKTAYVNNKIKVKIIVDWPRCSVQEKDFVCFFDNKQTATILAALNYTNKIIEMAIKHAQKNYVTSMEAV